MDWRGIVILPTTLFPRSTDLSRTLPSIRESLDEAIQWLCRAQDATPDGGVSEGYHLFHGWLPSYPETTGYIIETFLAYHRLTGDDQYRERALKMAEWLLAIQCENGAIKDSRFRDEMVFDTGQVLFGYLQAYAATEDDRFLSAAARAGNWLVDVQSEDGAWRSHAYLGIPHTYYSRVAWSLLELAEVTSSERFLEAGTKNIEWTIGQQRRNGWFDQACFTPKKGHAPITHTIAYTTRGVLEAGLLLEKEDYVQAAKATMDALADRIPPDGWLSGRYDAEWNGTVRYCCVTGTAQLAIILQRLYQRIPDTRYTKGAQKLTAYLQRIQAAPSRDDRIRGAAPGSDPIWGDYIHFCYINWATKFLADALMLAL